MRKYFALVIISVILMISPAMSAEEDIHIGVIEFSSDTVDLSPEQAVSAGSIFTRRLAMSLPENFTVVGYNKLRRTAEANNMSTEGYVTSRNASLIGKLAGCRYIIAGTVTELSTKRINTGINFLVKVGKTIDITTASANIRLIDTETGEILLMISDTTRTNQKDSNFTIDGGTAGKILPKSLGGDLFNGNSSKEADITNLNAMKASTMFLLSARLSQRISERLTGQSLHVESVSKKEVTLSAGTNSGARKGMLYVIYDENDDDTPNIAVVKVKEVYTDRSTATFYGKGYGKLDFVKAGDKIFPTDFYEAKAMVKEKTFMKSREGMIKRTKLPKRS
ncbi:MAG: hypothetical protein IJQ75_00260 [Synergistaceae bacterium]|nr:hypothetical protein [Synergistaceae bacterium]MBR0278397.1 hypothetical protein [Synergistaceae bacterium]